MKKRILYVSTVDSTVSTFLLPHIQELKNAGYEVEVACRKASYACFIEEQNIIVHHVPFSRRLVSIENIKAYVVLYNLIKKRRYSLVHVHTPIASILGRVAGKMNGVKTLYTVHGFHFTSSSSSLADKIKSLAYLFIEKIASNFTDALITINSEDYSAAKKYHLAPINNIWFIQGVGIDTNKFNLNNIKRDDLETKKKELGITNQKVIGMIGEFNPGKRHLDLITAGTEILRHRKDIVFLLIGVGPLLEKIKERVDSLGQKEHYHFLGWRNDIPQLMSIMDILVLPSVREGLPVSIQEAMSMYCSVIVTDIRGNRDLVIHRKTGMLVPPRCPEAITEAILLLLSDASLVESLGMNAMAFIREKMDIRIITEQVVRVHKSMLEI